MTDEVRALIGKVATGAALTREEAASAFEQVMSGEATPSQMGGLLMALRVRGETVEEITGAVSAMRAKMLRVQAPPRVWPNSKCNCARRRAGQLSICGLAKRRLSPTECRRSDTIKKKFPAPQRRCYLLVIFEA